MMKMTWLDRVIKLGDRLADLTERGVVALEKLAGTPLRCLHEWRDFDETTNVCTKCAEVRDKETT